MQDGRRNVSTFNSKRRPVAESNIEATLVKPAPTRTISVPQHSLLQRCIATWFTNILSCKTPLQFRATRRNKVRPRWNSPHLSRVLISALRRCSHLQKCSERVVVDQLLPTEKNKLMHGKWCNSTRAKSIHPERDQEPTNEQRSRSSPSPTIIHLSSVGLRSSASLWFPSFLSYSSERKGGKSDPLALIPLSSPPV